MAIDYTARAQRTARRELDAIAEVNRLRSEQVTARMAHEAKARERHQREIQESEAVKGADKLAQERRKEREAEEAARQAAVDAKLAAEREAETEALKTRTRDSFIRNGGTVEEFESPWPELHREIIEGRVRREEAARERAYRVRF